MALSATAITSVIRARSHLKLAATDSAYQVDAIDIYHDGTATAAATVEVTDTTIILIDDVGTTTLTFANASDDTLTELIANINAVTGWQATLLTHGDADSADLVVLAATSVYLIALRRRLLAVADRSLELIIEGVTIEIERWLDRGIFTRTYLEVHNLDEAQSVRTIILREPDTTLVTRLSIDQVRLMTVEYSGAAPRAWVEVTDTGIVIRSRSGGTTTEEATTTLFSAEGAVSGMATAISAVSDWAAAAAAGVNANEPTAYLVRTGSQLATREITLMSWTDFDGSYEVDYGAGLVYLRHEAWPFHTRSLAHVHQIQIEYVAGFASVPADVELVAWEMIAEEWHSSGRDKGVQSEGMGGYNYTVAASLEDSDAQHWRNRLASYRRLMP